MKKKFTLGNCYFNTFGKFDWVTLTFDLGTRKLKRFLCYPEWMCGTCLRRVGQGILQLLNGNGFGTFDPGDLDL